MSEANPTTFSGVELIAAERRRQIEQEGWTPEHDDEHEDGEIAMAAACYATPIPIRAKMPVPCGCRSAGDCPHYFTPTDWRDPWPWAPEWDKRATHPRIKQLVIAGALIAAEIDRLQRGAISSASPSPEEATCCGQCGEVLIVGDGGVLRCRFSHNDTEQQR